MRQNLYSTFMNSFVTISHLFDLNACQSPRVDEEFKSIWIIITYLPYNVKHCSLFFFIRWFFHLLSYLRSLIHKSKIFLVYGNFKISLLHCILLRQLGTFESFFVIQKCATCWSSPTLNCHANRVTPFVLFGYSNSLPRLPPVA